MLNENHDFAEEHPEYKTKIHELKIEDKHFVKLYDEYHELTKEILRIEKEIEASSEARLEDLKKQRLLLNDEMVAILER
jgi:hypothetical protein